MCSDGLGKTPLKGSAEITSTIWSKGGPGCKEEDRGNVAYDFLNFRSESGVVEWLCAPPPPPPRWRASHGAPQRRALLLGRLTPRVRACGAQGWTSCST